MRVIFWTEGFWPLIGGIPVLATKLLLALRERGYEVIVVASQDFDGLPSELRLGGTPIFRFPFSKALWNGNLEQFIEVRQRVAKLKRTFKPDLVHMNFIGPSALFHLHTAAAHPAPFLVTVHGALPGTSISSDTLQRRTLRSADWVTCVSSAVLAEVRQKAPEVIPHSSLIYDGLDVPSLPPEALPRDKPRLLCLGRLATEKGFDVALNAFASLTDGFPHLRLVIAGDGPVRAELERQAAALGLSDAVNFVGWVSPEKVPALLNSATVVVVPSRKEGFSLVALEAALMARPVVATRVGGLPEVVVHEKTGLLVEQEDTKALAEAITFLLDHPDMAAQMGQAARRRAEAVFSLERCVDAYDALYQQLIKGGSRVDSTGSPGPDRGPILTPRG